MRKPADLHGRDLEWRSLSGFAADPSPGATLGLMYGRRRQGKTLMLELLAEETGGFMFTGREQPDHRNMADLSTAYATFTGQPGSLSFDSWPDLLEALLRLGENVTNPVPVILDEFPNLLAEAPELSSLLQIALSPRSFASRHTRTRLILCGSAMSTMKSLLASEAPLRGRAKLELVLRPFWYREAAEFWGIAADPELAFKVHALLGGTPAYRQMSFGAPQDNASFGEWVADHVLSPASAMFREGNLLLREEMAVKDPTPYHGMLSVIATGAERSAEIAARLGRPATSMTHLFKGLEQVGLITRVDDAFKDRRGIYRLTDPLIRLHHLIIERNEAALVRGRGQAVWAGNSNTVESKIYGPHLEDLAREWCLSHAEIDTLGGDADKVLPATLPCREHQTSHELDIVTIEERPGTRPRVTAIGEVKATRSPVGENQLDRLEHLAGLIPGDRVTGPIKYLLFSRSGFTAALHDSAESRSDVELVDLHRLYTGS